MSTGRAYRVDRRIIVHQLGNRLVYWSIDHYRVVGVGEHRFHPMPQVCIIGTCLANERPSFGRLTEDSVEKTGRALQ